MNFRIRPTSAFDPLPSIFISLLSPLGAPEFFITTLRVSTDTLLDLRNQANECLAWVDDINFLSSNKAHLCQEELDNLQRIINRTQSEQIEKLRSEIQPFLTLVRARLSATNADSTTPPTSSPPTTTVPPSPPVLSSPSPSASN